MPEEEAGFTFVDKRRNVPQAMPEETPAADLASANFVEPVEEEEVVSDELSAAPTTYDLIGYCINLLASQAWQKLGLLADPQTGEAQPDLVEAKVAIDIVGDLAARLENAPESAVPADLRRDLRTLVNDLRLNYVSQRGPAA
jgi:hypothetical protein